MRKANVYFTFPGKYGHKESLLHLFVRCKLEGAAGLLLQTSKGKEAVLQQKDYRGRTPAEIARKKGIKKFAEMVDTAIVSILISKITQCQTEPHWNSVMGKQSSKLSLYIQSYHVKPHTITVLISITSYD